MGSMRPHGYVRNLDAILGHWRRGLAQRCSTHRKGAEDSIPEIVALRLGAWLAPADSRGPLRLSFDAKGEQEAEPIVSMLRNP